ncbi:NAD(P)H-dependent oxidoreductase [Pseudochryseolinea flava]|uniref:Flavodoxin family protein n=1 Tax=Pseudochryseolinea flava TaxID=2059302 RepID=A0A364Y6J7_9BACT|nr:NAD(P)H-dependent oxidoreductase [Pseudochryseolinea flava]RAW02425.1 flavodoxin family protein [Pseudochryseolinea flava]
MKKVLIINGHPDKQSYNAALLDAYKSGLSKTEAQVSEINIVDLQFNPNLGFGYRKRTELEPDLVTAIEKIEAAEHLVWVFPMWWYGSPAIMKGFIDRVFLPGIAFQPREGNPFPKKLWKGKSGHIIVTADTPRWYDWLIMKSPTLNQFKKGTLELCGVGPVKVTYIAPIKDSTEKFRKRWLEKVFLLGTKGH